MKESQIWYQISKLNGLSRALIFPVFAIGSALTFSSRLVQSQVSYFEMPVIVVYCNERDFMTSDERKRALQNTDIPIAHCQEKVTWQGEQREAISSLAYSKAEEIANSLFATPQNPSMVREAAAKNLERFESGSVAEGLYRRRMEETIARSASYASTFKVTDSYVRAIEREKSDDTRWVVKFSGIWVLEDGTQKGRDVSLMLSFKSPRRAERRDKQQALIVTDMEVSTGEK